VGSGVGTGVPDGPCWAPTEQAQSTEGKPYRKASLREGGGFCVNTARQDNTLPSHKTRKESAKSLVPSLQAQSIKSKR